MEIYHGIADLEAAVGKELGPTDWFSVGQTRIDLAMPFCGGLHCGQSDFIGRGCRCGVGWG